MKLTFLGAAHEVTGSRYLLEACGKRILVDYGMEQGVNLYENAALPYPAETIDFVLLTHAHIDHSGWLPLLTRQGFHGKIYSTAATADLCAIMLMDSAHIQVMEAEWQNRKAKRGDNAPVTPLYDTDDAQNACALFVPCAYKKEFSPCEGISVLFTDVGHLLGSASITLDITEEGKTTRLVFSGDIGNLRQPLLRDPEYLSSADYVVMESTYGDRSHGERPDYLSALTNVLEETLGRGGNVIIPSFAVGRTQEMLYFIRQIKQEHRLRSHEDFPVYVDSPLAIEATTVFHENTWECCDEETLALVRQGINPLSFPGLMTAVSAEESKRINDDPTPKVILSASGMCDAGRVRHHLKHNLWRPECTILFVGYQSVGTLGRMLTDGVKKVRLFGEEIAVKAQISQLPGVSGHADNTGLMEWAKHIQGVKHAFVTHGDDQVTDLFAQRLQTELSWHASAPYPGECWDLTTGSLVSEGNKVRLEKEHEQEEKSDTGDKMPSGSVQASPSCEALSDALRRLSALVGRLENAGSTVQQKLADQLYRLIRKFDR